MVDRIEILNVRAADGGARLVLTVQSEIGGERVRETLSVLTARMNGVPQKGISDALTLEFLRREHALCAAIAMGLRSLAAGGSSCVQLRQKLCARGVASDVAQEAVQTLCEKGYVEERENALAAAESDLRKLWGDRRILADLRAKGYGEEALEAVREHLSQKDAAARCVRLLEKHRFNTDNPEKIIAALMRYGYMRTEIREALRRVMYK